MTKQTSKGVQEAINDLDYLMKGHKNRIKHLRLMAEGDKAFERSVKWHKERIAWLQRQLERLLDEREHADELIQKSQTALKKLAQKRLQLEHHREVLKLQELASEISQLESDLKRTPCPYAQGLLCPFSEVPEPDHCGGCEDRLEHIGAWEGLDHDDE